MDLRSTYNLIAKDYLEDHKHDTWGKKSIEFFLSTLPKGGKVLDAGCGPGLHSQFMIERGFNVTGIDLSEEMIALAKSIAPDGHFKVQDMRDIQNVDRDFDGIHARASLLHLRKDEARPCIEELAKHLKSGGVLYVDVKGIWSNGVEEEIRKDNDYGYEYERLFTYFSREELVDYFQSVGLEILFLEDEVVGKTIWREIIGRKPL